MRELTCDICGGTLIGEPGGIFACTACGMRYDVAWARAKLAQPEPQPQPVERPPVQQYQAPAPEAPVYVPPAPAPEAPVYTPPAPAPVRPVYVPPAPTVAPTAHHLPPTARVSAADVSTEAEKAERKRRADADFAEFQRTQALRSSKKKLLAVGAAILALILVVVWLSNAAERSRRANELADHLSGQFYVVDYSGSYSLKSTLDNFYSPIYGYDYYYSFIFYGYNNCRISLVYIQGNLGGEERTWDVEVKGTGDSDEFEFVFTDDSDEFEADVKTDGYAIISISK